MTDVMRQAEVAAHPDVVGRLLAGSDTSFDPVKRGELDRAAHGPARVIASFGIAPGRYVLTVSLTQEVVQFAPFEHALQVMALIGTNADASPFDAARVESLCRQFDCAAVCGVDKGVLDGLAMIGHDPAKVFAGRVVWARPDAYDAVAALPGVTARRCAEIGPVLGLECREGQGLHVDGREWTVETIDGTLRVSSRMARITPLDGFDTRLGGRVERMPCACGSPDPRVVLA